MMNPQRNNNNNSGSLIDLYRNNKNIDQIIRKVGIETSYTGKELIIKSFSTIPFLDSIKLKKMGNAKSNEIHTNNPINNLFLKNAFAIASFQTLMICAVSINCILQK
jgi:hypothetical protein